MIFTILTNKLGGYYNLRQRFKKTNSKFLKKIYSVWKIAQAGQSDFDRGAAGHRKCRESCGGFSY